MKIIVLGDIHGRTCWKKIVEDNKDADKIVFLGDYVSTHEDIPYYTQIDNLKEILVYKQDNPDKVVLLRGNHDTQHLGYHWAECSGYDREVGSWMRDNRDLFLSLTQWMYIQDKNIFVHAGITNEWLSNCDLKLEEINDQIPSEKFGFINDGWRTDPYGDNTFQSLTWVRPMSLSENLVDGYNQIVGHTPTTNENVVAIKTFFDEEIMFRDSEPCKVEDVTDGGEYILLCDCLPHEYLVIEDGKYRSVKI